MAVDRRAREAFFGRIEAMQRDGELLANRKGQLCVAAKLDLVTGTVQGHPDGFGFLVPDDGSADLFLGPREMHKVLHGDRATARRVGIDRRGRPEGEIVDVLVARQPHDRRTPARRARNRIRRRREPAHQPGSAGAAGRARWRQGRRRRCRRDHRAAVGRARGHRRASSRCSGSYTDPGMEIEIALRKHDLPHVFSAAAERQADRLPKEVRAADRKGRIDLTSLPLVTIDGETARDFDDAVYCERTARGFRLLVAIADVSHYVRDGDALDRDARDRGTSVYFPRRVIPMLPEALSNELCSLKPDVDRLCVACEMDIDPRGRDPKHEVLRCRDALPRAPDLHAGLGRLVATRRSAPRETKAVLPQLTGPLRALPRAQGGTRGPRRDRLRHASRCSSSSTCGARSCGSCPVARNDAHKLIEECMLAANVCTAEFLERQHASRALPRARGTHAGEARGASRLPRRQRAVAPGRRRAPRRPTTRSFCCGSRIDPTTRCCRRCCCARCSRRATAPTTSGISACRTRRTRTSPRPFAAIPTCSSIARSKQCSQAPSTSRGAPRGPSWASIAR